MNELQMTAMFDELEKIAAVKDLSKLYSTLKSLVSKGRVGEAKRKHVKKLLKRKVDQVPLSAKAALGGGAAGLAIGRLTAPESF